MLVERERWLYVNAGLTCISRPTNARLRSAIRRGNCDFRAIFNFATMPIMPIQTLTRIACLAAMAVSTSAFAADRTYGPDPYLPKPDTSHKVQKFNTQTEWPKDATPKAPDGFNVTPFARDLPTPRWMYVMPNGDVLVAQARSKAEAAKAPEDVEKTAGQRQSGTITGTSPDQITLLRDTNGDGQADVREVLLDGLNQPFGMVFIAPHLYVANTDGVWRFPYEAGQNKIDKPGEKIMDLPAGGYNNHWTRNIIANKDNTGLMVSVGSASNAGEFGMDEEKRRANILSVDLDGKNEKVFASGLRNPNGMAWEPETGALWTAVNERDNIGDGLVPDYITSVQEDGFYGWPYSYWGQNVDPRLEGQGKDLVAKAIKPDYAMGNHTASLGLAFASGDTFPEAYRNGAFVGQRGSWNKSEFTGYKVTFVPFTAGRATGEPKDFLTGFMPNPDTGETYGRPVGVVFDQAGGLLVADDTGNAIWRVSPK